jgi:hypothetical protein
MSYDSVDDVLASPLEVVFEGITLRDNRKIREWLNDNAAGKWFLLMFSDKLTVKFMDESDLIHFMLVKSDLELDLYAI